jgi:hypothetical protein
MVEETMVKAAKMIEWDPGETPWDFPGSSDRGGRFINRVAQRSLIEEHIATNLVERFVCAAGGMFGKWDFETGGEIGRQRKEIQWLNRSAMLSVGPMEACHRVHWIVFAFHQSQPSYVYESQFVILPNSRLHGKEWTTGHRLIIPHPTVKYPFVGG